MKSLSSKDGMGVGMKTTIVLDAMGSDQRPFPELEGAVLAANKFDIKVILVGDERTLTEGLAKVNGDKSRVSITHAPEALDMDDHIREARAKKENSIVVGMNLVKTGKAHAFVTAGNTGMAMYFGIKTFGMISGVDRPCLVGVFPVEGGKCVIADIGANAEVRPEFLVQFGQMASVYSHLMLGINEPRVGLIANGEEEGKGNELIKQTGPMMRMAVPNFVGNIEGKELFGGKVDVAITDGFTGNVLLKSVEAVAKLILMTLKEEMMSSARTKLGALLAKPAFNKVRKMLDPTEIGSAPLLGLDGLVFIGHGRSDAKAIVSAVEQAVNAVESNLLENLKKSIIPSENQL
jgi:glycerol-3-phosphate acyltransferase PlsX